MKQEDRPSSPESPKSKATTLLVPRPDPSSFPSVTATMSTATGIGTSSSPRTPVKKGPPPVATATASASSQQQQRQSLEGLDFIGTSRTIKSLFSLPFLEQQDLHVAVHNIDGTLLIDDANLANTLQQHQQQSAPLLLSQPEFNKDDDSTNQEHSQQDTESQQDTSGSTTPLDAPPTKSSLALVVSSILQHQQQDRDQEDVPIWRIQPPPKQQHSNALLPDEPTEYLTWNFNNMNLLVGSDAIVYRQTPENSLAFQFHDVQEYQAALEELNRQRQQQQERLAAADTTTSLKPSYAQVLAQPSQADTNTHTTNNRQQVDSSLNENLEQHQDEDSETPTLRLQTCILPSQPQPPFPFLEPSKTPSENSTSNNNPLSMVIDAYLDNIMTNVPQLALCLHEKGLVQSVKLLSTQEIPFQYYSSNTTENLFSPTVMEMNASALLRFLQANCTKNHTTYLLKRQATELHLYDISTISTQRQRKWIWWLAMMSYRFALRLRQVSTTMASNNNTRDLRDRQRRLLQTTLELLQELSDMDGLVHETLVAAVRDNLADTFLANDAAGDEERASTVPLQQPYAHVSVDSLTKAQDHLVCAIKILWPVWQAKKKKHAKQRRLSEEGHVVVTCSAPEDSSSDDDESQDASSDLSLESMAVQLWDLHHKLITVTLRLAEHHLHNYWSSSAMQALRTAARRVTDSVLLLPTMEDPASQPKKTNSQHVLDLQLQCTWLWERCGHFARSFAADELWRDRGHACGDDVVSVLRDVDAVFWQEQVLNCCNLGCEQVGSLLFDTQGTTVSLDSLNAILVDPESTAPEALAAVAELLGQQRQIQREQRNVLVASCVSYSRAIAAFEARTPKKEEPRTSRVRPRNAQEIAVSTKEPPSYETTVLNMLRQRLGDACNETGKVLLTELRAFLGRPPDTYKTADKNVDLAKAAEPLLASAQLWFQKGLDLFESCHDLRNIALLRCNLCQCLKLRANSYFAGSKEEGDSEGPSHAEICLQEASDQLQLAHEAMGERDVDPPTWDMVSQELAATYLVLGVRRRQSLLGGGNTPVILQALRLSPGKERSIVEPMEQSLKIYEQSGNAHQAAAAHYQLALFYSKVWTCQRDEAKTREKLSAAFQHYNAAHAYFCNSLQSNEPTFVLLCLDLASLYAAVSGEECLSKAIMRCLDTIHAFSPEALRQATARRESPEWFDNMKTLASSVEDRVLKLLKSLVKLEEESGNTKYKDVYRVALMAKMTKPSHESEDDLIPELAAVHRVLAAIQGSSLNSK